MVIALFSTSIVLLVTFLFISLYLYKKAYEEPYSLRNHFPFEIYNGNSPVNSYWNLILMLAFIAMETNFVFYATSDVSFNTIFMCILGLGIASIAMLLFYIPIARFRYHITLDIVLAIIAVMINVFLLFIEVRAMRIYEKNLYLIPIVIQGALIITYLVFIFHPSLFNLKMEEGERPKTITLALFEWVVIISIFLSQIGLLFLDILG